MRWFIMGVLVAIGVVACAQEQSKATPADTTTPAEEPPPAPPRQEPNHIGAMPVLSAVPADGRCTVDTPASKFTVEGDVPARVVSVNVGPGERVFPPSMLVASIHQPTSGGKEENEDITVTFAGDGSIQSGGRKYFYSGEAPLQFSPLLADDTNAARQLALQVLRQCRGGGRQP